MAASILSVATAVPDHKLEAAAVLAELRRFWPELERLEETEVSLGTRYACEPVDQLLRPRGLTSIGASYLEHAKRLAGMAARNALAKAGVGGGDVDMVVVVSCTGYMVPSLDVFLAAELGLRPDVLRLPVTELGCSAGVAAMALAHRHLLAFPEHKVLIIAVELPSLNFQPADRSLDNLTACLVFGDGAGAALLGGRREADGGLSVEHAASHLVPGTADLLGFDLRDSGFHVVLDRRLPRVLRGQLGPVLGRFMSTAGCRSLDFVAVHAAGPRIFDTLQAALALPAGALEISRQVFAAVGNTSSAAIFFSLERLLTSLDTRPAEGLALGLGPGVSIELLHLAWTPSKQTRDEARPLAEGAAIGSRAV